MHASLNSYGYGEGNPVSNVDPTGEIAWGLVFAGADVGYQLYQNGGNLSEVMWGQVGLSMVGGGLLNAAGKGAFLVKWRGSHTWSATKHWMKKLGIARIKPNQERHHWLFEQKQGLGKYFAEGIKNQPWNINVVSAKFNNWLGQHPSLAWMGAPTWAGELAAGATMSTTGTISNGGVSKNGCNCN